jgi:N6-adenosine-specific RNA methylase IME4
MPLADVCGIPLPAILAPSAAVFLWVPTRLKFSHGWTAAQAWGLDYITTIYWNKCRIGMGYWFRNQVEELLVFQRRGGNLAPFRCQLPNIISLAPGEHSTKPEEFRKLIEQATGKISRRRCVELFARRQVPGWTGLGYQVTGRDIRADIRLVMMEGWEAA